MNDFIWCFSCKKMKGTKLFQATKYLSRGFEQCCKECNDGLFKREAIRMRTNEANRKARNLAEVKKLKNEAKEFKEAQRINELERNISFVKKLIESPSPERLEFLKKLEAKAKLRNRLNN